MKYGVYLFGCEPGGGSECRPDETGMNRSHFTLVTVGELETETIKVVFESSFVEHQC